MLTPTLPGLGAALRGEWALDPDWLTVNHGAYGATPHVVLAAQAEWRARMEAQPTRFMRRILPDALRHSAAALAPFINAAADSIVPVENATVGCNAVLRSLDFAPDDEILLLGHTYGAVRNTAQYVASRTGARIVELPLPFPATPAELDALPSQLAALLTRRTRLAILDHVTSPSALVLPVAAMARVCQVAGVPVLVDGAHGPGQMDVDMAALGADWYVGNCHKWLMAPKGCAFLWTRPDREAGLHPVTISHGYGKGYLAEFDWTGTRDATPWLVLDVALAFHARLGGPALRARNAALAQEAGTLLAERLGTSLGNPAGGGAQGAAMAMVRLPLHGPATPARALALRGRLLDEYATDAAVHVHDGQVWLRVSAQAYNEIQDYAALAGICQRLIQTDRPPA